MVYSPTALAAKSLGLVPHGIPWDGPAQTLACALERRWIEPGEKVVPFNPGPNFLDEHETERSGVVCATANLFLRKPVMLKTQRVVCCSEGAFSLATDVARTWFFLTPPAPPFIAVIADSMLQHLVWRAPVNLDPGLILFRHGAKIMTVRRHRLAAYVDALRAHEGPAFVALDREGKKPGHGVLRRDVPAALAAELADVTPGELIALATLAKKTPVEPQRPDPITL